MPPTWGLGLRKFPTFFFFFFASTGWGFRDSGRGLATAGSYVRKAGLECCCLRHNPTYDYTWMPKIGFRITCSLTTVLRGSENPKQERQARNLLVLQESGKRTFGTMLGGSIEVLIRIHFPASS